jgi:hypothetical protein
MRGTGVTGGIGRGVCGARSFAGFLECFAGFVECDLEEPAAESGQTDGTGGLQGTDDGALPRVVDKVFIAEYSKKEELEVLLPVDAGGFNGSAATVVFGACDWGDVWGISGVGRHPDGSGGKEVLDERSRRLAVYFRELQKFRRNQILRKRGFWEWFWVGEAIWDREISQNSPGLRRLTCAATT